mmetsp:Transcript_1151/g.2252  ORF Transcript_1151/g.2252 Transcript_1151/m.2252 type:complete len:208 (+) Transcript_1151:186-809(+)
MVPMSKVKQGSQKAIMHSLAHAENYAIDLMWDIVARFYYEDMPREFYDDWIRIAGEEAKHYNKWQEQLKAFGSFYGDLTAHNSLWESASDTADDLLKRLAVVHLVHEARGLDVAPLLRRKLERCHGPAAAAAIAVLEGNVAEEVGHVGAASRWFGFLARRRGLDPVAAFHKIVRENFHGKLRPPFNKEMRDQAGLTEDYYLPLAETR